MKRLDDPTDKVREGAARVLAGMFEDCPEDFKATNYKAHHDLIIDTLLLHFDDDEEKIQSLISGKFDTEPKKQQNKGFPFSRCS